MPKTMILRDSTDRKHGMMLTDRNLEKVDFDVFGELVEIQNRDGSMMW